MYLLISWKKIVYDNYNLKNFVFKLFFCKILFFIIKIWVVWKLKRGFGGQYWSTSWFWARNQTQRHKLRGKSKTSLIYNLEYLYNIVVFLSQPGISCFERNYPTTGIITPLFPILHDKSKNFHLRRKPVSCYILYI